MDLEDGARVVVEAARERMVEPVGNAERVEGAEQFLPVGAGGVAEEVNAAGRGRGERLAGEVFGIEQAQRIRLEAAAVVLAEMGEVRAEMLAEGVGVSRPVFRVADAVERERHSAEPKPLHARRRQLQNLQVDRRVGVADGLDAELMELAEPSRLRAVVAEHWAEVVEADGQRAVLHAVLEVGAADRRRALGAERDLLSASVEERVHFLLDDVGFLADGADEEGGVLEDGRVYAGVAERLGGFGEGGSGELPEWLLLRQDVRRSAWRSMHCSPLILVAAPRSGERRAQAFIIGGVALGKRPVGSRFREQGEALT